jgi:heavy metal translocating P-type ATPase
LDSKSQGELIAGWFAHRHLLLAGASLAAILVALLLRYVVPGAETDAEWTLRTTLYAGGLLLICELLAKIARGQFGADLLAGIAIVVAAILGQYLAGVLVVLMLSGGEALEAFAVRRASSVLQALARRMPSVAHLQSASGITPIAPDAIEPGNLLVVMPHEICPVDGEVVEGSGNMDEAYLTGEPYQILKSVGSQVISGALNGQTALTIRATKRAVDSRYARIMQVMHESQQQRPRLRRLGDQLGAAYTPFAVLLAGAAWWLSGDPIRFLAVLVTATPCPLLIAIPTAIIGSISLAARRGIIIRDPMVLEQISQCRTMLFDKTGTLTYGEPRLAERHTASGFEDAHVLRLAASLEQYSRHPLGPPLVHAARQLGIELSAVAQLEERAGEGLRGVVDGQEVQITSRMKLATIELAAAENIPAQTTGLECVILIGGHYAATYRFRDEVRSDGRSFVGHLGPRHHFDRLLLVSGDREPEVRYLAEQVGIDEVYAGQSPEEKLAIVRAETAQAKTLFLGDGINDAPALSAATVGVAFGSRSEITSEAAGAVILDTSLQKVDELMHIARRMRRIALQSALGGMALSMGGMAFAAWGWLPPVAGAILQEGIDVAAVINALRAALPPRRLSDI